MADENTPTLAVGGKIYSGWTAMTVTRSIENIAGGFDLELTERWDGQAVRWPIKPGEACKVAIGGDVVIDGFVDDADISFDASSHRIRVSGRDRTGYMVDCSAVHKPDEWTLKLEQIAAVLARPFGVAVKADVDTGGAFSPFKLQQGESAFEAIDRMCRMRAVLPISDARGGMLITRAGTARSASALIEGVNLLSANARYSWKDRYSEYLVKGQSPAGGGGGGSGDFVEVSADAKAATVTSTARDAGITRYRPLIVLAEGAADGASSQDRAAWEAAVRAGRGTKVTATVQGWRQADGALWPINALAPVRSELLDLDDQLLIVDVRYVLDGQGTRTEIGLTRPDAYRLIKELPKGKAASGLPKNAEFFSSKKEDGKK